MERENPKPVTVRLKPDFEKLGFSASQYSARGHMVAIYDESRKFGCDRLLIHETASGRRIREIRLPQTMRGVRNLQISRDGRLLVVQESENLIISVFDVVTGKMLWKKFGAAFRMSGGSNRVAIVTNSEAGYLFHIYDTATGDLVRKFPRPIPNLNEQSWALSSDGQHLITSSGDGNLVSWAIR